MSLKKLKVFNNFGKLTIYQSTTTVFKDLNGFTYAASYGVFSIRGKNNIYDSQIIIAPDKVFKERYGKDWKKERDLTLRHEFMHYAAWIFKYHEIFENFSYETEHLMIYNQQLMQRVFNLSGNIDWIFKK